VIHLTDTAARRIILALLQDGDASPADICNLLEVALRGALQSAIARGEVEIVPGTEADPRVRRLRYPTTTPLARYRAATEALRDDTWAPPTPSGVSDRSAWVMAERLRSVADLLEQGTMVNYAVHWLGPKTDAELSPGAPNVPVFEEAMELVGDNEPATAPVTTPEPEGKGWN
jgi:hypothetical protein